VRARLWLLPASIAASLFFAIVALSIFASIDRQRVAEAQRQEALTRVTQEQKSAAAFRRIAEARISELEKKVDDARAEVLRINDGLAAQIHTHNTESLNQLQTILDFLAQASGRTAPRLTTTTPPPRAPAPPTTPPPAATTTTTTTSPPLVTLTTPTTTCPARGKSDKCAK